MDYFLTFFAILLFLALTALASRAVRGYPILDYRNDQMESIAKWFHLSFESKLPSGRKVPLMYFRKRVEISETTGTLNGHRVLIRETYCAQGYWASRRMGSRLVSYIEIDGKGEEYTIPDSMLQTEIPLNRLWDILRNLAGSTVNVPEKWEQSIPKAPPPSAKTIFLMFLLMACVIALIVWSVWLSIR